MPWHVAIDGASERRLGKLQIGTTRRGIGPCYADKALRLGIRVQDLLDPKILRQKIEVALAEKNLWLERVYGEEPLELEELAARLERYAQRIRPYIADTSLLVDRALRDGASVLFEGGQGTLLDLDHGTYPFVTSSSTVAANAATGVGIGPNRIDRVLGVAKAYVTRVGEGPFPTEIEGPDQGRVQQLGGEFGTVTGRERRCGWLDLVALRYAVRLNGITSLALTKLDVLSDFGEIPVCTRYRLPDGSETAEFPAHQSDFHHARPVYETLPGWREPLDAVDVGRGAAGGRARLRRVRRARARGRGLPRRHRRRPRARARPRRGRSARRALIAAGRHGPGGTAPGAGCGGTLWTNRRELGALPRQTRHEFARSLSIGTNSARPRDRHGTNSPVACRWAGVVGTRLSRGCMKGKTATRPPRARSQPGPPACSRSRARPRPARRRRAPSSRRASPRRSSPAASRRSSTGSGSARERGRERPGLGRRGQLARLAERSQRPRRRRLRSRPAGRRTRRVRPRAARRRSRRAAPAPPTRRPRAGTAARARPPTLPTASRSSHASPSTRHARSASVSPPMRASAFGEPKRRLAPPTSRSPVSRRATAPSTRSAARLARSRRASRRGRGRARRRGSTARRPRPRSGSPRRPPSARARTTAGR